MLLDAARLVREQGHCKGRYKHGTSHCAVGAIRAASGLRAYMPTAHSPVAWRARQRLVQRVGAAIVDWNDAPERTAEEVAQALEAAARFETKDEETVDAEG